LAWAAAPSALPCGGINGDEIDQWDLAPFGPNTSRLDAKKTAPGACSFTGNTKVMMADGSSKAISEIKVGDKVLAADPETGRKGPRAVTHLIVHKDTVQDLVTEGGASVTTTEDHPFWSVTDKQWQRADTLDPGDSLLTTSGEHTRVVGLLPASQYIDLAYNLTVDELHTYYVLAGDQAILVHNSCPRRITLLGRTDDIATHKNENPDSEFNSLNLQGTQGKDRDKGPGAHNWTRNKQFIDDALARGDEIRLVTNPNEPIYSGGNWYQRELDYLDDLGYDAVQSGNHWILQRK
jgi:hypothetical protein